jgi:hypothetical protein
MTKSPVNNGIDNKKGRGGQHEIKFPSPKKDEDVKKRHKIINLVHPDALKHLTDEHSKISMMLGNISRPWETKPGTLLLSEVKSSSHLIIKQQGGLKLPNWANFYGSYVLMMMVKRNSHWKLTKSMQVKLHAD